MNNRKISALTAAVIAISSMTACSNISEENVYPVTERAEISSYGTDAPIYETSEEYTETAISSFVSSETETEYDLFSDMTDGESDSAEDDGETEESEEGEVSVSRSWSETNSRGVMYVVRDCVGREAADDNSTIITKLFRGDAVEISALTDSGFYKIKGGGYIHLEYLSDNPVTEASSETETETEVSETSVSESKTKKTSKTEVTEKTEKTSKTKKTTDETNAKTKKKTTAESEEKTSDTKKSKTTLSETEPEPEISASPADLASSINYTEKYCYKQLSKAEQQLYGMIVDAVQNFESEVTVPSGVNQEGALKVYMEVFNEEPQLFWMGSSVSVEYGVISLKYKAEQKDIEAMQQKIDANVAPVIAKVNAAGSTYEKLKIMYRYIVLNNDAAVDSNGFNETVYNAFTDNGNIQCAGYAKAVKYLCDIAGIDCTVVVGRNTEGGSHAWNVVYCEDGYYNLDATWGDPINSYDGRYIRYTYFLVPDSQIHNISHLDVNCFYLSNGSRIQLFTPPACTKTNNNYFVREGLYFKDKDSADAALKAAFERAVENGENAVQIRVSDPAVFEALTNGTAASAYLSYVKKLSPSVKSITKMSTATYKATGVVTYDIIYKS